MNTAKPIDTAFQENDEVVLAAGTYQGTRGVFLRFRNDARWASLNAAGASGVTPSYGSRISGMRDHNESLYE